jgi:heptosyltransferase-2
LGSKHFLTEPLAKPDPREHRYEYWRVIATALDLPLPPRDVLPFPPLVTAKSVLIHSGAGQPVRVWPLERYRLLAKRLRAKGHRVIVVCDADQRSWWMEAGESQVGTPETVSELMSFINQAGVFIGNDSGPGHLAASCGVPTFTVFGPQLPEWFAPLHPAAAWLEGKACPYRPCSDYCRFERPRCLWNLSEEEVWPNVEAFVELHLRGGNLKTEIQEV